jgi:hypothetical protein
MLGRIGKSTIILMSDFLHSDWDEEEFDPRERPEDRAEMEEFAATIIGPEWREEVSRRELVDFWIWNGGKDWRQNVDFIRDWYREQKKIGEEESGEKIPDSELRALGECIEPTEELYAAYRRFDEPACRDLNANYAAHGLPADRRVLSFDEFVAMVEDWKCHDPAELYRKVHMWNTDYEEWRQELSESMRRSCEQVFAFFQGRKKSN